MSQFPRHTLTRQWFGSLVFDHRLARYLPFDHALTEALIASVSQPIHTLLDPNGDDETARACIEHFYNEGLFTPSMLFDGVVQDTLPLHRVLTGPLSVHLEVVARCNLSCTHCFAGELPRKSDPLTLNELDALFRDLSRMGAFRLSLTGGEPLLRKDLCAIIDLAIKHQLHPCITTNGLLLNERWVQDLSQRKLLWLNVSLDGTDAITNDTVRGEGTFDAVVEKVALLKGRVPFSIAFTVMKHNALQAEKLTSLAQQLGANAAVLRPLYPVGTAVEHPELLPTFAQYQHALATMAPSGSEPLREFSPATRANDAAKVIDHLGCGAGTTTLSISADGTVNPCSFLGAGFNSLSVKEHSVQSIWQSGDKFAQLREFAAREAAEQSPFRGGCRARAQYFSGSAFAVDPWVLPNAQDSKHRHPLTVLRSVGGMCAHGSAKEP